MHHDRTKHGDRESNSRKRDENRCDSRDSWKDQSQRTKELESPIVRIAGSEKSYTHAMRGFAINFSRPVIAFTKPETPSPIAKVIAAIHSAPSITAP